VVYTRDARVDIGAAKWRTGCIMDLGVPNNEETTAIGRGDQ
jgi:hypothetical protein